MLRAPQLRRAAALGEAQRGRTRGVRHLSVGKVVGLRRGLGPPARVILISSSEPGAAVAAFRADRSGGASAVAKRVGVDTLSTRSTHTARTAHTAHTAHTQHTPHTPHTQHTQHAQHTGPTRGTHSKHRAHASTHTHTPHTQHTQGKPQPGGREACEATAIAKEIQEDEEEAEKDEEEEEQQQQQKQQQQRQTCNYDVMPILICMYVF